MVPPTPLEARDPAAFLLAPSDRIATKRARERVAIIGLLPEGQGPRPHCPSMGPHTRERSRRARAHPSRQPAPGARICLPRRYRAVPRAPRDPGHRSAALRTWCYVTNVANMAQPGSGSGRRGAARWGQSRARASPTPARALDPTSRRRQRSDAGWWKYASVRSAQGGFSVGPTCRYRCASTGHEAGHPSFGRSGGISGPRCWLRHGRGSPVWLCGHGPGRQLGVADDRLRDFRVARALLHVGSCPCAVWSASTPRVDRDRGGCGGLAVPHHPPDQRGQLFLPHGRIPGRVHRRARPPQPDRSCRAPRYVRPAGRRRPSAARAHHLRPESHAGPQLPRHDLPAAGGLRLPDLPSGQQDRRAPCRPGPHGLCQDCGPAHGRAARRYPGRLSPIQELLCPRGNTH